jgi:Cysteine dioxygenase type I
MTPRIRSARARARGLEGIWSSRRVHHFDEWCRPGSSHRPPTSPNGDLPTMSQLVLPPPEPSFDGAPELIAPALPPLPASDDGKAGHSPATLARIARHLAAQTESWSPLLQLDMENRWYMRLTGGEGWEAWLLTWWTQQGTDLHDHGGAAGAFTVLSGQLQELTPRPAEGSRPADLTGRTLRAGAVRTFGSRHIHQVINVGECAAASLHVYSPALTTMNRYYLDPERGPVLAVTERAGTDW